MRKLIVFMIVAILVLGTVSFAKAADSDDDGVMYENCVTTNVWPWLIGFYNLGYERMLGTNISVRPRASYFGLIGLEDSAIFALGADVFFHPMNEGIQGWYLGPRYDAWIATGGDTTGMMHFVGGMFGYKMVFEGGFTLGIALGVQINIANSISYDGESETLDNIGGTLPAFDAEIGWAF